MKRYDFKDYRRAYHPWSFGIEIEVSHLNVEGKQDSLCGFHIKSDGSLRGYNPAELVSNPLTFGKLHHQVGKLYKTGLIHGVNDSCGIHIHVGKTLFPDIKGVSFAEMFLANKEFSERVAGRKTNSYWFSNDLFYRYGPVNMMNKYTNEVRIFSSSLREEWVHRCIDVVGAMVAYKGVPQPELFEIFFLKKFGYSIDEVKP